MLVIKDMELPKSCLLCPLIDNDGWYSCDIKPEARTVIEYDQRANDCPLVEIVTCKNCKHLFHIEDVPKVLVCGKHNCQQVSRNFYCADGERREK
jgi:hypothetical protein